jgi:outer membrane protein assembly factor BamE
MNDDRRAHLNNRFIRYHLRSNHVSITRESEAAVYHRRSRHPPNFDIMPKSLPRLPYRLLLAAAIAATASGCGMLYKQPIYQGNLIEKSAVEQLQVGMSKQDVQILLGTPSIADPFSQNRWDYTASQRIDRRGNTNVKNFVVFFENDAVTKWEGEYFPEQDDELANNSRRQFGPNLPKDDKKKRGR